MAALQPGLSRRPWGPAFWLTFTLCVLVLCLAVPLLNRWISPDSPFAVPDYLVPLLGKYLCYAILALSLDLIWGYAGILSLGHGAFFALGGYCMGMYLMREIGARGVYRNPVLPDFMVFLQYKELPWFWWGFDHFAYAAAMVVLVPGMLAFVFGWLAFRSRVTGVYLSIITQAMTYALLLAFFRNDMGFGGNNGLTDYKDILGWDLHLPSTRLCLYVATAIVLGLSYLICRFIVTSKLGRVLRALRDAESRVRFLGYSVTRAKLFVFTVSAVLAGIAGALYVPQVGIINPSEFSPGNSIEIAIWVSVGGRATLIGGVLGAVLVNLAKSWLTGAAPEAWLFVLGGLFVLTTLVFPRGIVGLFRPLRRWRPASPVAVSAEVPAEEQA
jgi:urea transport system permease protein